jgi:(p)ppGpp synthase/HD superfamily hydrolase
MLYTELTKKAMLFAYRAHEHQLDKGGMPYIMHPLAVAEMMGDDESAVVIAILHDVIEDTRFTADDLLDAGFSKDIVDRIVILSRMKDEKYMDYLARIKQDPLAVKVKLGDLKHNSDLGRLSMIDEKACSLHERYKKAIAFLTKE